MENFEVSLVNYLCPICGKVADTAIIMNSLLTEKHAKEVKNLNGKNIGYSDRACKECAKYKDEAIFFIGIDGEKSSDGEPYRTGQIVGIKKTAVHPDLKKYIKILSDGTEYVFIAEEVGKEMGLW